jgi:hypothetical protein
MLPPTVTVISGALGATNPMTDQSSESSLVQS